MFVSLTGSFLLFTMFFLHVQSSNDASGNSLSLKERKFVASYPLFFWMLCIPPLHALGVSARLDTYGIVYFLAAVLPFHLLLCCIIMRIVMRKTLYKRKIVSVGKIRFIEDMYAAHVLCIIFSLIFHLGMRDMLFLPCPVPLSTAYETIFSDDPAYARMDVVRTFPDGRRTLLSTFRASKGFSPDRQAAFHRELVRFAQEKEISRP